MRLLPYERITLRTALLPEEAAARLKAIVGPASWLSGSAQPFRGTVQGRRFKIAPVLPPIRGQRRQSLPPVLVGDIAPGPYGSELRLRIRLHFGAVAFLAIWLPVAIGVPAVIVASVLEALLQSPAPERGLWWFGGGALAFVVVMALAARASMMGPFERGLEKARALLGEALGCRELESIGVLRSS